MQLMTPIASAHSFLAAARHLIQQASEVAGEHIGDELEPAVRAIDGELAALAILMTGEANASLAARLGPGFSYNPD